MFKVLTNNFQNIFESNNIKYHQNIHKVVENRLDPNIKVEMHKNFTT